MNFDFLLHHFIGLADGHHPVCIFRNINNHLKTADGVNLAKNLFIPLSISLAVIRSDSVFAASPSLRPWRLRLLVQISHCSFAVFSWTAMTALHASNQFWCSLLSSQALANLTPSTGREFSCRTSVEQHCGLLGGHLHYLHVQRYGPIRLTVSRNPLDIRETINYAIVQSWKV